MHAPHRNLRVALPVSSTVLLTPAISNHPGKPACCICSLLHRQCGFQALRRPDHFRLCNEAESSSLALRLMSLSSKASTSRLLELVAWSTTRRTSTYHVRYLSIEEISQASPGTPKAQRRKVDFVSRTAFGEIEIMASQRQH